MDGMGMIDPQRIRILNRKQVRPGNFVLYWMQAAQRSRWNHALEYAAGEANRLSLPLLACFSLTSGFPEANFRHYHFMVQGVSETEKSLEKRGVRLLCLRGDPDHLVTDLARRAALLVCDRGYLRIQRHWREKIAAAVDCPVIEVEGETVIPVDLAGEKHAFSAAVLRPRIRRLLGEFLHPPAAVPLKRDSMGFQVSGMEIEPIPADSLLHGMEIDRSVPPSPFFSGGESEARRFLDLFLEKRLPLYHQRNDPARDIQSGLGPYLHFGQISPLEVAWEAAGRGGPGADSFLDELIVRRELSVNFVRLQSRYDEFSSLPAWARETLEVHRIDPREWIYDRDTFEKGETHDPYWNAAQNEMRIAGKMHGYMRMYWGKKILEWSESPEEAYRTALYLNNRWSLDGRDPNSFAGVAWCFGLHDRPWRERAIFGKVRYMNDRGLERKFDMRGYLERVEGLKG